MEPTARTWNPTHDKALLPRKMTAKRRSSRCDPKRFSKIAPGQCHEESMHGDDLARTEADAEAASLDTGESVQQASEIVNEFAGILRPMLSSRSLGTIDTRVDAKRKVYCLSFSGQPRKDWDR
eukprot:g21846.t1